MSLLAIYPETGGEALQRFSEPSDIQHALNSHQVQFERWDADFPLADNAEPDTILAAYQTSIDRLKTIHGFQSVDVINMYPEHPDKQPLREKFFAEHCHADFEVRFFIQGQGLFYLHLNEQVFAVLCTQGDLISVPKNTPHWFDMGAEPNFKCIRLFTTPEGWVADFTGSDIAQRFPDLDQFSQRHT
ncbi:MAG: AraC family ligand binding domain-containing protein [Methylococcales bacterium]|nr:AraC family ligand binding domain-containing protein [Methylococcales bacterium]